MKLVTYNIQFGRGRDGKVDLDRIVGAVAGADVIALQEVERFWRRSGDVDQVQVIADALPNYFWIYGAGVDLHLAGATPSSNHRRQFGNMLLARAPLLSCRHHLLPKVGSTDAVSIQRSAVEATVRWGGDGDDGGGNGDSGVGNGDSGVGNGDNGNDNGDSGGDHGDSGGDDGDNGNGNGDSGGGHGDDDGHLLRFYSLHLTHLSAATRAPQVQALLDIHRDAAAVGAPVSGDLTGGNWHGAGGQAVADHAVLLGDFNFQPDSAEYDLLAGPKSDYGGRIQNPRGFVDAWCADGHVDAAADGDTDAVAGNTSDVGGAPARLDYCFVSNALKHRVRACYVDDTAAGSDHFPLWVELDLTASA